MAEPPADFRGFTQALVREGEALRLRSRTLRIEVVRGPDAGLAIEAPGPEVRVGTSRDCALVLGDPTVSRLHLTLRIDDRGVRVVDAGSRNGTVIDGLAVRDAYARADSIIVLGQSALQLRLLDQMVDLPLSGRDRFGALLGGSVAMRRVFAVLERVAATDMTVLIEGETGTGKELAAEALHEESARAAGPFVVLDCSAVSPSLIESEVFGHARGAFSGAFTKRTGVFEAADGGTLFLDEIGELPLDLQPKLLRVLESHEVRLVGSNSTRSVDVRVIAATNRSLDAEVERRRFREDLYYRLAVIRLTLPPLRERPEDIRPLVEHFVRELVPAGCPVPVLSELVLAGFHQQVWSGNVRELRNAVARTLSLGSSGEISTALAASPPAVDLSVPLRLARERAADEIERAYLLEALRRTGGNVTRAAELAGVNRKFFHRALRRHGLGRGDA